MGVNEDDYVTLNYTFFGDETLLVRKGAWVDIVMDINHEKDLKDIGMDEEIKSYSVDLTIFVARGSPPDNGLDGTLSICVTP